MSAAFQPWWKHTHQHQLPLIANIFFPFPAFPVLFFSVPGIGSPRYFREAANFSSWQHAVHYFPLLYFF